MKKRLVSLMALALCLVLCGGAVAQTDFPTKEITYLCGYGAGGSSDIQARLMQPYAEEYFGQPMVVENLGGAGGCTALTDFNTRAADGYTISSFNTTPLLKYVMGQTDFDYFEVFDFLACVITTPIVVVVTADSPYQTIEELNAAAQENPEMLLVRLRGRRLHHPPCGRAVAVPERPEVHARALQWRHGGSDRPAQRLRGL